MGRLVFTILLALVWAGSAQAQQRNQTTVEASIMRGALGYARQVDARLYAGVEIGFGFPQLDRTLVPEQNESGEPDFREYLHLGVVLRAVPSAHFEIDVGVRGSFADFWPCGASDCWPSPFIGGYVQPMVGWRRLKFGPRLTAGWVSEVEPGVRTQEE